MGSGLRRLGSPVRPDVGRWELSLKLAQRVLDREGLPGIDRATELLGPLVEEIRRGTHPPDDALDRLALALIDQSRLSGRGCYLDELFAVHNLLPSYFSDAVLDSLVGVTSLNAVPNLTEARSYVARLRRARAQGADELEHHLWRVEAWLRVVTASGRSRTA